MNKLLPVLIVSAFAAASFSASAQDNPISPEQITVRKETAELQVKKETASQYRASAKPDAKYTAAHQSGKSVARKRRPMFK
ncbi:MAG: hypothetical protein Q7S46_07915 [Gallionella sp.]|nr:hypothetical protein [Gallionella sp.]